MNLSARHSCLGPAARHPMLMDGDKSFKRTARTLMALLGIPLQNKGLRCRVHNHELIMHHARCCCLLETLYLISTFLKSESG